jgi:methionyl aminopeptidase
MSKFIFKSNDEIELIRASCGILAKAHAEVAKNIKEGVDTKRLNKIAEEYIRDNDGVPSFLNFNGFPWTLCISLNDQVVHGFPSTYCLKEGDIVSIDCGVIFKGYFSDSAYTYSIGNVKPETERLLKVTKECLELGIEKAIVGNRIGDIGYAVQNHAENAGFGVVRELVGHGVGTKVHEKPEVPNYGKRGSGIRLEEGMVLAIEPMINEGKAGVKFWDDGWTVSTRDKLPSAHFEHTVAIRKGKADILSSFADIEEVLNKRNF